MAWLHRVTREISDLIDLRARAIDPVKEVSFIKPFETDTDWTSYHRPAEALYPLQHLDALPDEYHLGEEVAEDILRAIIATGRNDFEMADSGADVSSSSVEFLRRLISAVAEARGLEVETVVSAAFSELDEALNLAVYAEYKVNLLKTELAERAEREARAHLPGDDDYARLLRFKRSHERSLAMWVGYIESSQRARAGDLPPPIRLRIGEG